MLANNFSSAVPEENIPDQSQKKERCTWVSKQCKKIPQAFGICDSDFSAFLIIVLLFSIPNVLFSLRPGQVRLSKLCSKRNYSLG